MATLVGGLRARFIKDSIFYCLHTALTDLGWFDAGRQHAPISFNGFVTPNLDPIPINSVSLSDESMHNVDLELGSTAVMTTWVFYVDFYAEDDDLGKHLINDVRDILGGRMSTIGRPDASVPVYDWRMATPTKVFTVGIDNLMIDRAHDFPKPWQKHWYTCRFDVTDAYGDETVDREYDDYEYDDGSYGSGGP